MELARERLNGGATAASAFSRAQPVGVPELDEAISRRVTAAANAPTLAEARDWQPPRAPDATGASARAGAAPPPPARPDDLALARLAQAVYADPGEALPKPWTAATPADLLAIGVRPTDLAQPGSAFRARVYAEGEGTDRRFVLAFRGSTADLRSWIGNGRQAAGLPSDHYARAMEIGRRVAASGAGDRVVMTGHSLGGGLAASAALASGRDAVTFNAAGLSRRTIETARAGADPSAMPDIRAYHVRGEILSVVQDGGDRMLGALLGAGLTRSWSGGAAGYAIADAPEAHGRRIELDAVRPEGVPRWADNAWARHDLGYVLSGLAARR